MAAETQTQRMAVSFTLNGKPVALEVESHVDLLRLLRDTLGLTGAKRSCDMQVCGACTVLVDGRPVSACTLLAFEVRGADVVTIEGLVGEGLVGQGPVGEGAHPLMRAFIEHAGFQCGYCTPGMILTAKSLLDQEPAPSEERVREYMEGNICRCTGYKKIVESVLGAAGGGD